jgi:glutamate 5-kinase
VSEFNFSNYRRLVIKVGSSLLVDDSGIFNISWLNNLADDIADLFNNGHEIFIVSSGAIAIGSSTIELDKKKAKLPELQAAAAIGQVKLVNSYQEALSRHNITVAQILLTPDDTEDKRRFLNARRTFNKLIDWSTIPVINENDTVTTEEIRYGDNDRLAARVAQLVMADALILLSDIDGLYTSDPLSNSNAKHVNEVTLIDEKILQMAGNTQSNVGTGGMVTKLQAAGIATHAGCVTLISSGIIDNPLQALKNGNRFTIFHASDSPAALRKQWMAGLLDVQGVLSIDDGAMKALFNGSSLLPVGVFDISGNFERGDVVNLESSSGKIIGRGLVEYSSGEATKLLGIKSDQIENTIGYQGRSVMVHRDELVLFCNE